MWLPVTGSVAGTVAVSVSVTLAATVAGSVTVAGTVSLTVAVTVFVPVTMPVPGTGTVPVSVWQRAPFSRPAIVERAPHLGEVPGFPFCGFLP